MCSGVLCIVTEPGICTGGQTISISLLKGKKNIGVIDTHIHYQLGMDLSDQMKGFIYASFNFHTNYHNCSPRVFMKMMRMENGISKRKTQIVTDQQKIMPTYYRLKYNNFVFSHVKHIQLIMQINTTMTIILK